MAFAPSLVRGRTIRCRLRPMVTPSRVVALALALTFGACGGSSDPPSPGTPAPDGGETITGRERIGWAQPAQDAAQLATFDYAAYVDGARHVLANETCTPASGGTFDCSSPLPPLTPGQHTIELVAFVTTNGTVVESERSAPLRVTVAGATPSAPAAPPQESTLSTSDGYRLRAIVAAQGLDDPTDLAVAPDGRIFVTERAGRVRIVGPDGLQNPDALELRDVAESDESGLTAIALHPEFEKRGHVYLAYAIEGRDGPVFRITRFREQGGILGEGAVIARERVESPHHVVVRFGQDRRLYAGFATGPDPRAAQNASSVLGKILRLNDDGTTPRDNPGPSAVYSSGHRDPRALAWRPSTGDMWEVERDREAGDELNTIVGGGNYGWPLVRGAHTHPDSVPAALVLPAGTDVSGACFVPLASSSPLAGELLVASRGAEDLLRIRVGANGRPGLVEGLLQGRYGRVGAVDVAPDGTIYVATANRETWGPGRDVLIRIGAVD